MHHQFTTHSQFNPQVAEARGPRDLQAPPSHEGADAAAGYGGAGGAGPAKGPWNRTSAGWGRFAGLAIGARQVVRVMGVFIDV